MRKQYTFTATATARIRTAWAADNGDLDTFLHEAAQEFHAAILGGAALIECALQTVPEVPLPADATPDQIAAVLADRTEQAKGRREWARRAAVLGSFKVASAVGYQDARTALNAAISAKAASAQAKPLVTLAASRVWESYAEVQASLAAMVPQPAEAPEGDAADESDESDEGTPATRTPKSLEDWLLEVAGGMLRRSDKEGAAPADTLGALAAWMLVESHEAAPAEAVVATLVAQVSEAYSRAVRAMAEAAPAESAAA